MPFVVEPSDVNAVGLCKKELRGGVCEVVTKTTKTGKEVVEVHIATGPSPEQVYAFEGWNAQGVRVKKSTMETPTYLAINTFEAKDNTAKARWSPSLASTYGEITKDTKITIIEADETNNAAKLYPTEYPCFPFEQLQALDHPQQVNLRGEVSGLLREKRECKFLKGKLLDKPVMKAIFKCVLKNGNRDMEVEFWEAEASLFDNVKNGQCVDIQRGVATPSGKGKSVVINAGGSTKVRLTKEAIAKEIVAATAAVKPDDVVHMTQAYGGSHAALPQEAKIATLSAIQALFDEHAPRSFPDTSYYEVVWVQVIGFRNSKQESDVLSYEGCANCYKKQCDKHQEDGRALCYSMILRIEDSTAVIEAKCFTAAFRALMVEAGLGVSVKAEPDPEELSEALSSVRLALRLRLLKEEPFGERKERNSVEVTEVKKLPMTFQPDPSWRLVACRVLLPGAPDILVPAASVSPLGQMMVYSVRTNRVHFMVELGKAKPKIEKDEFGICVTFAGVALPSREPVSLRWCVEIEASRPVMMLGAGDIVYATGNLRKDNIWAVAVHNQLDVKNKDDFVNAYIARAKFAESLLSAGRTSTTWEKLTPVKRQADLDSTSLHVSTTVGTYPNKSASS